MESQLVSSLPYENSSLPDENSNLPDENSNLPDENSSLPDENGRLKVLEMGTKQMKEHSGLASDVNLEVIAAMAKNYSSGELEVVIRRATSYACVRSAEKGDTKFMLTMEDFRKGLDEVVPAMGVSRDLGRYRVYGIVECHPHKVIYQKAIQLVKQVEVSEASSLGTLVLEGPRGSGKTSLAVSVGIDSEDENT